MNLPFFHGGGKGEITGSEAHRDRFIDLKEKFLLSEIVTCLKNEQVFVTGPGNISRDYVRPKDLIWLIIKYMEQQHLNEVFDVFSATPVSKFNLSGYNSPPLAAM